MSHFLSAERVYVRAFAGIMLLLLCATVKAGIVITGNVTPQTELMQQLAAGKIKPSELLPSINLEAKISAEAVAQELKFSGAKNTPCCHYSTNFFQYLESGRADLSKSRLTENPSQFDVNLFLSRQIDRDILTHWEINTEHSAESVLNWLDNNLLDGESVLFSFVLDSGPLKGLRHSTNLVRISGVNYLYDLQIANEPVNLEEFIGRGDGVYKVNLLDRVSVTRVVRDNVRYTLSADEIRNRRLLLNGQLVDLTQTDAVERAAGFDRQQLLDNRMGRMPSCG